VGVDRDLEVLTGARVTGSGYRVASGIVGEDGDEELPYVYKLVPHDPIRVCQCPDLLCLACVSPVAGA
jgi:hypothetical protein